MNVTTTTDQCAICYEGIESTAPVNSITTFSFSARVAEDDMSVVQTKCKHIFHNSCLHKWIQEFKSKTTLPTCPTCRATLIDQPAVNSSTSTTSTQGAFFNIFQLPPTSTPGLFVQSDLPGLLSGLSGLSGTRW